ncbi:HAD family hydrolase [Parashewanella tropica]|uniref:HAD family hydrolase n=1 Tax=Parashewanella tropica TaxID=2547970 RepID=UPI00105A7D8C|nr:HAD family hydrolase [Parashewanella tropica]
MAASKPSSLHQGQTMPFELTAQKFNDLSSCTLTLSTSAIKYIASQCPQADKEVVTLHTSGTFATKADYKVHRKAGELPGFKPQFKISLNGKKYQVTADTSKEGLGGLVDVQVEIMATEMTIKLNEYLEQQKSSPKLPDRDLVQSELDEHRDDVSPAAVKLSKMRPTLRRLPVFNKPRTAKERRNQANRESRAFTLWEGIREQRETTQDRLQMGLTLQYVNQSMQEQNQLIQLSDLIGWEYLEEQNEVELTEDRIQVRNFIRDTLLGDEPNNDVAAKPAKVKTVVAPSKPKTSTSISEHMERGKVESVADVACKSPYFKEDVVHLSELVGAEFGEKPVVFFDADEVLVKGTYTKLPLPKRPNFTTLENQGPEILKAVIKDLKASGANVYVLSASGHNFLPTKLREAGIDPNWFDGVYGKEGHGMIFDEEGEYIGVKNKGDRAFEIYKENDLDTSRPIVLIDDGMDNLDAMAEAAKRLGCRYTPVHFTGAIEHRHMQLAQYGFIKYESLEGYYVDHNEEKEIALRARTKKAELSTKNMTNLVLRGSTQTDI